MANGKRGVNKTRQAKADLVELAAYYGNQSLSLEMRFLVAAENALDTLARMPRMGSRRNYSHPMLRDLRMWPVPRFPNILVFYRCVEDGIEVIRVLHAERDIATLLSDADPASVSDD